MLVRTIEKPAAPPRVERTAEVHCLICSHRVPAQVVIERRNARVKTGEKCARCGSSLEAGYVLALKPAA
jgi:hypothetical protein